MASNKDKIREKYQNFCEDDRATRSRYAGLEFFYTKKHLNEYINKNSKVIEVGCGTGYYGIYYADKCKEYLGIDLSPENISLFNKKIENKGFNNVKAQVGDATNLTEIADKSYDVVLCLGPIYHLPPKERELVMAECDRICNDGGVVVFAYINKVGVYVGGCLHDKFREYYPNEKANECVLKQNCDDVRPDLFFYTMPEEMEALAKKYGFTKLKNLGTDFFMTMSIIDNMSDEKFELMKPLLDQMASHESCTGMSNHAVLVCRKG